MSMSETAAEGRLTCVGLGMMLGAHLAPRARSHIEQADKVFVAVSDPVVELWLQQMRGDVVSLQPFYAEGKSRRQTYREMVEAMLVEVRAGHDVCAVFYGHPGVFAQVPHQAIAQARREGFHARMEPGISAEDCLYADLSLDPGQVGCQHYEASQFLFYRRRIDPSAYLVLWQVGLVGDRTFRRFSTGQAYRQLLVDRLLEDYPGSHPLTIYEASTLPICAHRAERVTLESLAGAALNPHSTLVVPPSLALQRDDVMLERLRLVEAQDPALHGACLPA